MGHAGVSIAGAIDEVLEFWFDTPPTSEAGVSRQMQRWFGSDPEIDAAIRSRFEPTMRAGAEELLGDWAVTSRGRLALIILLDQFPRSIYRGEPAAFAQDARALSLTLTGSAGGLDRELPTLQRLFFYMPMQHAEALATQEQAVEQFEALARDAEAPYLRKALNGAVEFARLHRDIIARFGRFPHRNSVLGRDSTEPERKFLADGGPRFGQ
jgi:uncharacterized protein (DUF924 family)